MPSPPTELAILRPPQIMKTTTALHLFTCPLKHLPTSHTPRPHQHKLKHRRGILLKVALLCTALHTVSEPLLLAQNPPTAFPDPPPGPCWKIPAPPTSWKINFRYTKPPSEAEAEVKPSSIAVTLIGQDSHHLIEFRTSSLDVWKTAGRAFISETGSPTAYPHILGNHTATLARDTNTGGAAATVPVENLSPENKDWPSFPELEWVTPQMFKGKIPLGTQVALIYAEVPPEPVVLDKEARRQVKKWPEGPLGGIPLQPGMKALAVDETTRLPMVLQLGDEFREYKFHTGEIQKIELPPKVKVFLEKSTHPEKNTRSLSATP